MGVRISKLPPPSAALSWIMSVFVISKKIANTVKEKKITRSRIGNLISPDFTHLVSLSKYLDSDPTLVRGYRIKITATVSGLFDATLKIIIRSNIRFRKIQFPSSSRAIFIDFV